MDINTILIILALVTGVYEVVARVIPSVKDWTVIGNIIKILRAISDALNARK